MPATGKVSVLRQTIYAFIPILDLYAAYHIKKLRWYLVIMIASGIVISTITSVVLPQTQEYDPDRMVTIDGQINWGYVILGENPEVSAATWIVSQAATIAIAVYLIRRWSKEWNRKFEYSS